MTDKTAADVAAEKDVEISRITNLLKEEIEVGVKLVDEIVQLKRQLTEARNQLDQIVCTRGQDRGLVLKDPESPTKYDEELKCQVYQCENFSLLGDALISLWDQLTEATESSPDADIRNGVVKCFSKAQEMLDSLRSDYEDSPG